LPLEELPPLDAVVISHDHYDHLDLPTVLRLRDRVPRWIVPLGVGAHLEQWGVDPAQVTELDWWQDTEVAGVTLTCTPARHFSGRWVTRFRSTLWAGWAMRGPAHSVFYSGDTALHPTLAEIGARLGPFDLTAMDAGAYDSTWTDVHLGPEQAVIAHQLVRGGVLLPVHWGLFDLANHGWTEPMERVLLAARRADVPVLTPRPGASVELTDAVVVDRWWPDAPFATVDEDPVWSTSVDDLLPAR
jgi:L-ascorbate metabolism protein UlaG (beta-lactamase superfamily)